MQHLGSVLFFILLSGVSHAYEARFEIDKSANLEELTRTGATVLRTFKNGKTYVMDASAVLHGDFERLARASADFDHFVQMGMPNLRDSRVVSRSGEYLVIWSWMSTSGQTSKHYLEVQLQSGLLPSGAVGNQWQHVRRQSAWPYEERSAFTRLDGSWFQAPLADGPAGDKNIYVRYFLAAEFDTAWPDWIVSIVAKSKLADGVRGVIQVLARQAQPAR